MYHQTPVHLAAGGGQLECLQLLLDNGGSHDCKDIDKKTPLDYAQREGYTFCEKLLTKHSGKPIHLLYHQYCIKGMGGISL